MEMMKTMKKNRRETLGKILTLFLGIICFLGIAVAEAARHEVLTVNKLEITRGGKIVSMDSLDVDTTGDMIFTVTANAAAEDMIFDLNGNQDASILISSEGSGTDSVKVETLTNGGDIVVSSVDNIQITSTTASGLIDIDGTAGLVYSIAEDDTTADNIDIGSAKDDLDLEGEDITLDTADDMNFAIADDLQIAMESAAGVFNVNGTLGAVYTIATDNSVADDIDIGSALDDVDIEGEDITLDTSDDGNATVADDWTFTMESAGGIFNVTGTLGFTINLGTNDTTADTINIGSAKDTISVAATSGVTLSNSESINNGTNGAFDFTRNDSGTVTITSSDDDATADLTIAPGGNSTLTLNDTSNDTLAIIGQAQVRAGDLTIVADTTGGNAGAVNQFIGIPRIQNVGISTMVNGAAASHTVITDIGDSETPATDWTAIDADVVMSNDSSYYRQGTASLKMAIATTADATDGCTNTLASGDQDWTDDESVGMWIWSDTALTAGDLTLVITDSVAGDTSVNFPAVTALSWQWIEIDVSGVANASKDVITDLSIELSAAGAVVASGGAFNVYMDFIVKWDVGDEDSLGVAILTDGVMSLTVIDATDSGATSANLVLYTDYFVHYQSGSDAIVMVTDQSGADKVGLALVAY